ncbi:AbrB/MazE/SpoVT family DNA-binding domain-containing protein [Pediococcus ethanolidurans]|uniref:AbrB/MazE/SpoVT family DNA-binding domain-containing protein n=1 Tax=Pediococcus ethanolidurans TaxID=319653 RepID=UPI0021E7A9A6|nr:AbrB/MazE/SpoVT family DNA-binding domain-containing protein [Pediococcus ethanolidurans]MCV3315779.1 AbrB/MazE/SpoVT family DNA-binding domain-containing protein [Pediococcus ethanolidurans]
MKQEMNHKITVKVTSRGRITIPKNIRKRLGLTTNSKINFLQRDQTSYILQTQNKDAFWNQIDQHIAKYGRFNERELYWGPDVGAEIIDD